VAWADGRIAGLARSAANPNFDEAEAAVIIRADLRDKGLATHLLQLLLSAVAEQGVRKAVLVYPARLDRVQAIATELGFSAVADPVDPSLIRAVRPLR
jgi:N-acetylglutamate synthase-like GNAT family acetyltransferase